MNLEDTLLAFTQLGATWVLWLLCSLSVLCVAVIAERIACYWSSSTDVAALLDELDRLAKQRDFKAMLKLLSESPSFEARVAAEGLTAAGLVSKDREQAIGVRVNSTAQMKGAEARMKNAEESARIELEKNLVVLGTVGANAPFVGLLGTVIGIIGAFRELERTRGLLSDVLMREIGEALVATAVGLLVALPAVVAFNAFRRVVQARLQRTEMVRNAVLGFMHTESEEH